MSNQFNPPLPMSEDFAVVLGLKVSTIGTPPCESEQEKLFFISKVWIPRLLEEHPLQRDIVLSRFAAIYLPRLIEAYLDSPAPVVDPPRTYSINADDMRIHNGYGHMLVHLQANNYFTKYFRAESTVAIRRQLAEELIRRMRERAVAWEATLIAEPALPTSRVETPTEKVETMVMDYSQLLGTVLMYESSESRTQLSTLPETQQLLPVLERLAARLSNGNVDYAATRAVRALRRDPEYERMADIVRKTQENLSRCAIPYCSWDGELRQCQRCKTVRYCSVEHQNVHWRHAGYLHKEQCHSTVF